MALPSRLGQLVLWNSSYSVQQLPAIIVGIPKYVIGGALNDDGQGNAKIVDVLIFSMQGQTSKYHVTSSTDNTPGTWSPMPTD